MKTRIRFSDGRSGFQETYTDEHGEQKLSCVTVTHDSDGTPCVPTPYCERRFIRDGVFSFADLGNVTWEIVAGRSAGA